MRRTYGRRFGLVVALGVAVIASQARLAPAQSCQSEVARAVSVQGTVEALRKQAPGWQPVKLNDAFCPGDTIRVQDRSRADVALLDQSVLRLNAGATITVETPKDERTSVVDLVRGAAHFFSRGPRSLDVKTPFIATGVRGTDPVGAGPIPDGRDLADARQAFIVSNEYNAVLGFDNRAKGCMPGAATWGPECTT